MRVRVQPTGTGQPTERGANEAAAIDPTKAVNVNANVKAEGVRRASKWPLTWANAPKLDARDTNPFSGGPSACSVIGPSDRTWAWR